MSVVKRYQMNGLRLVFQVDAAFATSSGISRMQAADPGPQFDVLPFDVLPVAWVTGINPGQAHTSYRAATTKP